MGIEEIFSKCPAPCINHLLKAPSKSKVAMAMAMSVVMTRVRNLTRALTPWQAKKCQERSLEALGLPMHLCSSLTMLGMLALCRHSGGGKAVRPVLRRIPLQTQPWHRAGLATALLEDRWKVVTRDQEDHELVCQLFPCPRLRRTRTIRLSSGQAHLHSATLTGSICS